MKNKGTSAKKIALGGILGALVLICLFFAVTLPTSRISLYALASFFVSVIIIEAGISTGWLFYVSTGLLSFVILPDKVGIIPYLVFFGLYGIVKYYIEKLDSIILEYVLKLVYFNACLVAAIFLIRNFFVTDITVNLPWWIVIVLLEVVFVIYDYVYTLFVAYFREKIKPKLGL
ncbi:MAG: hypothetical protein HGA22_06020 [Clostridiales bacterium]|nr:hypothetical protein [Clostridiales bacterium]